MGVLPVTAFAALPAGLLAPINPSELLLAAKLRDLALSRIEKRLPTNLTPAETRSYFMREFQPELFAALAELQNVAALLRGEQ